MRKNAQQQAGRPGWARAIPCLLLLAAASSLAQRPASPPGPASQPRSSSQQSPGSQPRPTSAPTQGSSAAAPGQRYQSPPTYNAARPGQSASQSRGQHLPEWMEHHQNLNADQKENALRQEQGFNHLSEPQQQQLINRLHKLDSAPPQVRQRMLARNEIFEHLPPERQQAIRGASQALTQMPSERNQAVRHAFRDLRGLPPDQRQNVLNSARFQAEFSSQERTVLDHLLSIEPYQP